ncbi:MAG: PAS domain S-box protein, partial [Nitrospinae bacterium]|nr:PAS domain S-box protein [Nitrospinota bacterium]
MDNVSLEIVRALFTLLIFAYLLHLRGSSVLGRQSGWGWIVAGFGLIFFGTVIDVIEEIIPFQAFDSFRGASLLPFLENLLGYLPGFACLAIGLWKWIPVTSELQRAQAELDLIFENALVGIALVRERKVVRANQALEEMFGWSRQEFIGQSTEKFYPAREDYERMDIEVYPILALGETYHSERTMKRKDGSLAWRRISGKAVDKSDLSKGSIWIIQDIDERKRAETARQESEERFRTLAEAAFEGIMIHRGGVIIDTNQAAAHMLGYAAEELAGMDAFTFIAPEERDTVRKNIQSGYDKPYEVTVIRKNGERAPVEVRGKAATYKGEAARIVAVRDISAQKRLDEEIRKSAEFFRTLVEESPDCIFTLSPKGEFLKVNKACAALSDSGGLKSLLTNNLVSITAEGGGEALAALAKAAGGEPSMARFQSHAIHAGRERWWDMRLTPLKNERGEASSVMAVARDVTKDKLAEDALRKSEEKYRNVINTTGEGFWAINENLETVEVNDSLVKMLGYTREKMMTLSILDLVDAETRDKVLERLTQIPSTTHRRYDVTLRSAGGSLIPMVFNGTTLRDKEGHVTGAFSFITNVSEIKRAQEELKKARDAAESASRLKDKFVSLVSHDLKAPVISILSLLELIRTGHQGSVNPQQAEALLKASKVGENMISMIDRLLDIGRLQSGAVKLDKRYTSLSSLVNGAFDG